MSAPQQDRTITALRDLLAPVLSRHALAVLSFSGGKESLLLLHALRPWADRLEVVHVNTGANFPHMDEFIQRATAGFKLVQPRSDQVAHITRYGFPTRFIPIRNTYMARTNLGQVKPTAFENDTRKRDYDASQTGPMLQDGLSCCTALRWQPMNQYVAMRRPGVFILGQRERDGWPINTNYPLECLMPLWTWTEAEVYAAIEAEGIELPDHYAELGDSLDCWSCTADVNPKRMAWMRGRYPELAAALEPVYRAIIKAGDDVLEDYRRTADALSSAPSSQNSQSSQPSTTPLHD